MKQNSPIKKERCATGMHATKKTKVRNFLQNHPKPSSERKEWENLLRRRVWFEWSGLGEGGPHFSGQGEEA